MKDIIRQIGVNVATLVAALGAILAVLVIFGENPLLLALGLPMVIGGIWLAQKLLHKEPR